MFIQHEHDWEPSFLKVKDDVITGFLTCRICGETRKINKPVRET